MDSYIHYVIATTAYKLVCLIVGLSLSYLGYRLFMSGIWGSSGDLEVNFNDNRLVLKKAAPGTFFALFGAVVIGLTISKGINFAGEKTQTQIEICEEAFPNMPD